MSFKLGSKDPFVREWEKFLRFMGYNVSDPNNEFDIKTDAATRLFQKDYGLKVDGDVGSITIGKATELGFNPEKEPLPPKLLTKKDLLFWIKNLLGNHISLAVNGSNYSEDWLAGMAAREFGYKIIQFYNKGFTFEMICENVKGDYSKRPGEPEKTYHGFGFWQIDTGSYPGFVASGKWKDPLECCKKAVSVLDEKRNYLQKYQAQLGPESFERSITAAYNCGQGNVEKAIKRGLDIDNYTFSKDYSKEVFENRKVYSNV